MRSFYRQYITWNKLQELYLSWNQIGNKAAIAKAGNPAWNELSTLELSENRIGNEGAIAIGMNAIWKQLRELYLNRNEFEWKGRIVISHNLAWRKIIKISLDGKWIATKERKHSNCPICWSGSQELLRVKSLKDDFFAYCSPIRFNVLISNPKFFMQKTILECDRSFAA